MLTVVESTLFQKQWPIYWDEDERAEFAVHISANPEDGVVIKGSGGVRKVRWSRSGSGKSGGLRVIYLVQNQRGEVVLLTLYSKGSQENIPLKVIKEIRRALEI